MLLQNLQTCEKMNKTEREEELEEGQSVYDSWIVSVLRDAVASHPSRK